jgi:hydrogenase/urease accessory protein HupE
LADHAPAAAHEVIPGLTGLPSLFLHPFVAVDTLLVMLVVALIASAARPLTPVTLFLTCLFVGTLVGVMIQVRAVMVPGLWRFPLLTSTGLGLIVACGASLGRWPVAVIIGLGGLVTGLSVTPERPGFAGALEAAAASALALAIVIATVFALRRVLPRPVAAIAVRVAGAWVVAIAMLALAALSR